MCGINGIVRLEPGGDPVHQDRLIRTRDHMARRGPDGSGAWISPSGEVGLAHRRLAILDLTDAGLQPMASPDGRYHLVFNGEIYNFRELRQDLESRGIRFHSRSDTEVLIALFALEGTRAFARLRGMYALGLWDELEHRLVLARDPYGIKPLYWARHRGALHFASQVRALTEAGGIPADVDPTGVAGFLLWGSVPEPRTIRRAVRAVPAGHHIVIERGRVGDPVPHRDFWTPAPDAAAVPDALSDSVRAHLVSDVPVAVFLSAGLDSSLIAALARRHLPSPPTTVTLRFAAYRGTQADEGPLAAKIAAALGTNHVEVCLGDEALRECWDQVGGAMDQPSVDGFNTYLVSRAAREAGFKVVLSGLGGDELLGGYPSFQEVPRWAARCATVSRLPGARALVPVIGALSPRRPKLAGMVAHGGSLAGAYFLRRGLFLPSDLPAMLGPAAARDALADYDPVADAARALPAPWRAAAHLSPPDAWRAVHWMESAIYMRNQLLRDADWASMAHALELRVPLVDARLQAQLHGQGFEPGRSGGKASVVRLTAPELPAELWERRKTGFSLPLMESLEPGAAPSTPGARSRRLALRVLRSFDIDLEAATASAS
ncbi:MAG TPA: asparagine synthase (glutamine-hydrolyzing) [Candidatus Polarisedimenticolaceae bacterium]|nr:asparagine synthase (glutamine-hydrolyzing) [Candidatus Polarisedimenticolaceae bacterium]